MDAYTKVVLTVIAVALSIIAVKGSVPEAHAGAYDRMSADVRVSGDLDVKIVSFPNISNPIYIEPVKGQLPVRVQVEKSPY